MKVGQKINSKLADLQLINKDGQKVRIKELHKNNMSLIVFVRHFNCFLCRDQMVAINRQLKNIEHDKLKVSIVSVGKDPLPNQPNCIAQLCEDLQIRDDNVYMDPTRASYKELGLIEASGLKELKGNTKSEDLTQGLWGTITGYLWSFSGMARRGMQGNMYQMGGTILIDQQGVLLLHHIDISANDCISAREMVQLSQQYK